MGLDQARALANEHAPDALIAASRATVAFREVAVAGMLQNPIATFGSNLNTAHFYTVLNIPAPIFGQRGSAMDTARAFARAADDDVTAARLDVRYATTIAWIDLWLAEHEATSAGETADRNERLFHVVEERVAEGVAPRLDSLRIRAESLRTRADADAARQAVAVASARLAQWLGDAVRDIEQLHTQGSPPDIGSVPPLAALLAHVDQHPMMVAAQARTFAADANIALEVRRRLPVVGIEVGATFFDPTLAPAPNAPAPAFSDAHIALSAELPMFHVHGPLVARARAAREQTNVDARAARVRIESDLRASYAQFQASSARTSTQWRQILPAMQEASDLALESYQAGRSDINGLLAAQQALADARISAWRLSADLARAVASVEHASGVPL